MAKPGICTNGSRWWKRASFYRPFKESYHYQRFDLCHYGIQQRWLVLYSDATFQQAEKSVAQAQATEYQQVQQQLFHLQAQRFDSQETAHQALDKMKQKWRYHKVTQVNLRQQVQYVRKGRPTKETPIKGIQWQIKATVVPDGDKIKAQQQRQACFVLATNISDADLTNQEMVAGYKGQSAVEQGFRFLKDPLFFVSSLFVKKPSRICGLLMVMTLALLVYSVAQRRLEPAGKRGSSITPSWSKSANMRTVGDPFPSQRVQ